ncbi:MAG: FAD-binding oxidoreductase [Terriglobus roseus]|nr:FAD-binding oxidoreductase [Terriglobus roseus]
MAHGDGTVIVGSGIMGCATAYFLSESGRTRPDSIHLIDASAELFNCASGLAGGFLAKDCTLNTDTIHRLQ